MVLCANPKAGTAKSQLAKLVDKNTSLPKDQGPWMAMTRDLMESVAFRTMSINASRALNRIILEHTGHGRKLNGELIVTHKQFIDYGVSGELVGDAVDELAFRGLLRITRGRAGNGTAHPNIYRLTFDGSSDGLPATNDWRRVTMEDVKRWTDSVREECKRRRASVGRKSKTSLRVSEIRPLRVSEIREVAA